jgi:hypothetical protein
MKYAKIIDCLISTPPDDEWISLGHRTDNSKVKYGTTKRISNHLGEVVSLVSKVEAEIETLEALNLDLLKQAFNFNPKEWLIFTEGVRNTSNLLTGYGFDLTSPADIEILYSLKSSKLVFKPKLEGQVYDVLGIETTAIKNSTGQMPVFTNTGVAPIGLFFTFPSELSIDTNKITDYKIEIKSNSDEAVNGAPIVKKVEVKINIELENVDQAELPDLRAAATKNLTFNLPNLVRYTFNSLSALHEVELSDKTRKVTLAYEGTYYPDAITIVPSGQTATFTFNNRL